MVLCSVSVLHCTTVQRVIPYNTVGQGTNRINTPNVIRVVRPRLPGTVPTSKLKLKLEGKS